MNFVVRKKQLILIIFSSLPTTIISMTKVLTYSITSIIVHQ